LKVGKGKLSSNALEIIDHLNSKNIHSQLKFICEMSQLVEHQIKIVEQNSLYHIESYDVLKEFIEKLLIKIYKPNLIKVALEQCCIKVEDLISVKEVDLSNNIISSNFKQAVQ
jgi:hypothetical protein